MRAIRIRIVIKQIVAIKVVVFLTNKLLAANQRQISARKPDPNDI